MNLSTFCVVILAALLHAIWHSIVKGGSSNSVNMTGVVLGHTPLAILCLFFAPSPAPESWPYIIYGLILHASYQLFLLQSYRLGDLTQVYPIARGTAPLLVALISILFLGVTLQPLEQWAVLTIGIGILSLSLTRQGDGLRNIDAARFAFFTGCFTAAYSISDGMGARLAGTSLGFYCWLTLGNTAVWIIIMSIINPRAIRILPKEGKSAFWLGGSASFIAYALIMWAFTQAPITLVTALRETSIIFALLIGVFFLREKLNLIKVFSTMTTILGAALLRFAK